MICEYKIKPFAKMIDEVETNMKNVSLIRADGEKIFSDDHVQVMLAHFRGSGNPPNLFFQDHTWILYIYALICVHGFIMNTFLVISKKFELIILFLKVLCY